MPAFARTSSPAVTARTACLGGKITGDQRIDGCTALIAAKGTRRKDLIGAYLNRGADYLSKNNNDAAIANFSELIRLDPKYFGAYTNRGEAYRRKGLLDQAIADLNRAIALNRKEFIRVVQPRDHLQRQGRSRSRHRRLQPGDPAQFARCLVLQ